MTWRPVGFTFLGVDFGFRKVSKKLDPVPVSQPEGGSDSGALMYCRLVNPGRNRDAYWQCAPTVADIHNNPPTNTTQYPPDEPPSNFIEGQ